MAALAFVSLIPLIALLAVQAGWNPRVRVLFAFATLGTPSLFLNALYALTAPLFLRGTTLVVFITVLSAVTVVQLWLALPLTTSPRSYGAPLTITACNVLVSNAALDRLASAILGQNPDVIVLSEVFDKEFSQLVPLLRPFVPVATGGQPGFVTAHRRELAPIRTGLDTVLLVRPGITWTPAPDVAAGARSFPCVVLPHHAVTICAAHTTSPHRPNDPLEWRTQLSALAARATASTEAFVVAGDLNASFRHAPLRNSKLKPGSLRWRPTWPAQLPVLELDHVLAANCHISSVQRYRAPGSDHLGITARIV